MGDPGFRAVGFDAFISYSHSADDRLAPAVQRGLERLGRAWYQPRASQVFRDETGLAVTPELWESIRSALDDSQWFVVLCSPDAARSPWVDREVHYWLDHKESSTILLVVTDGVLEWDPVRNDFAADSTALPPALQGRFRSEPRYLPLQWARDEDHLDLRHPQFRSAIAQLAEPVRDVPRAELEAEDVRQQRRAARLARGGVSLLALLLVVAVVFGVLAYQQRTTALHEKDVAQVQARSAEARQLAAQTTNLLATGRSGLALLLAAQANRLDRGPAVRSALLDGLTREPSFLRNLPSGAQAVSETAFSPDGRLVAAVDASPNSKDLFVWDAEARPGQPRRLVSRTRLLAETPRFLDGGRLLAAETVSGGSDVRDQISVWNVRNGARLPWSFPVTGSWNASAGATTVVVEAPDGRTLDLFDAATGAPLRQVTEPSSPDEVVPSGLGGVALSPDGSVVAFANVAASEATPDAFRETVDAWSVGDGTTLAECQADVGGGLDANFRQPPPGPIVLDLAVDAARLGVTSSLTGGTRAIVSSCDLRTGAASSRTIPIATTADMPVVAITSDGTVVATRDQLTGTVRLVDAATGTPIGADVRQPPLVAGEAFAGVTFSPDGSRFVTGWVDGGDVKLYRTRGAGSALERTASVPAGAQVTTVSPDGALLVVAVQGGEEIVRRATGRLVTRLPYDSPYVVFDPMSRAVVQVARATSDHPIRDRFVVMDLGTGRRRQGSLADVGCDERSGGLNFGSAVAPSPGARQVAFGCGRRIVRVDVRTSPFRKISDTQPSHEPDELAWSPDGRYLVAASEILCCGGFDLFEFGPHSMQHRFGVDVNAHAGVGPLAFSRDGGMLATGFDDGELDLWRITPQRVLHTHLRGSGPRAASAVTFDADGSRLAAMDCGDFASGTGDLQLWDTRSGTLEGSLASAPSCVVALAYASQETSVVSAPIASSTGSGPPPPPSELQIDVSRWLDTACAIANRNLTRAEWSQYLPHTNYELTCPPRR